MEQKQSERLLNHLSYIRDMVNYLEVSGILLASGTLCETDHQNLLRVSATLGNAKAMDDLVHLLSLRRGAFASFINALRENDYNWLAEYLNPEGRYSTTSTASGGGVLSSVLKRRSSRKASRSTCSDHRGSSSGGETVFTSYRQSIPMDLLSYSTQSLNHPQHNHRSSLSKSFDNLTLSVQELAKKAVKNKEDAASALLLFPQEDEATLMDDSEVVVNIAKELNFPLPQHLRSLKRVSCKSKPKSPKNKNGNGLHISGTTKSFRLKIKFNNKAARDRFVEGVNLNSVGLGGIKSVPLDSIRNASEGKGQIQSDGVSHEESKECATGPNNHNSDRDTVSHSKTNTLTTWFRKFVGGGSRDRNQY